MLRRALLFFAGALLVPDRIRPFLLRLAGVVVGRKCHIFSGLRIHPSSPGAVVIGDRVLINRNCDVDPGVASVVIGDDVALGVGVVFAAAGHQVGSSKRRAKGRLDRPIVVESGCWLGARVVVLQGVTIAKGCVIGAGAVVTRSTAADGIYAGVPARRLRDLG